MEKRPFTNKNYKKYTYTKTKNKLKDQNKNKLFAPTNKNPSLIIVPLEIFGQDKIPKGGFGESKDLDYLLFRDCFYEKYEHKLRFRYVSP